VAVSEANSAEQVARERGFVAAREALLLDARRRTGFDDFGSGWEDGFSRVLADLDRLGLGETIGRTTRKVGSFLDARLYAEHGWKQHPECLATPIRQPLIIAGLVRSGTTALHKLLAMDPQFQSPEYWLTHTPMPRPPREKWIEVPEYRAIAGYLDEQIANAPAIKDDHNLAADEAEESIFLLAQTFANNMFCSLWDVPDYDAWYRQLDETPQYRRLADNLRLIGHGGPDKRWLLKNPTDLHALDAVLNAFPDAMIVQTHRDPVQAIPSIASLIYSARRAMCGPEADPARVGQREAGFWREAVARALEAKSRARNFIDIEFRDFIADQMGTVRRIYDAFGLALTAEAEGLMQSWLDANPRKSQSLQRVQPEDFGLTRAGLEEQYATYRAQRGYA